MGICGYNFLERFLTSASLNHVMLAFVHSRSLIWVSGCVDKMEFKNRKFPQSRSSESPANVRSALYFTSGPLMHKIL